jgi:putative tricarboxylic transport membrane protein
VNWRGLFGPPEMPDYAVEYWRETLAEMVETDEWAAARETNGWDDAYMDGPEFADFLTEVDAEYREILDEIGMLAD